ncbi:MAG TPA: FAD:protein FMN transferase, partial [Oxalicibacterium sp.]
RTLVPHLDTPPQPPRLGGAVHALHGDTMGTTWNVKLVSEPACELKPLQQAIEEELALVIAQMSTWEAESHLSRFNRAPAGSWQTLPEEFFAVLDCALQVARDSGGAYDPTAGALVNAWGFGPTRRYNEPGFIAPTPEELQAAQTRCGWQRIVIDTVPRRAFQPGGLYVDFSAIAKGFAVDQVARRLRRIDIDSFLVEIGGELRGEGTKPDGQPWWITLEQPGDMHAGIETIIALYDWSIATSGDYRRYFEADGTRHSHTIDPRTGQPIRNNLASVTVLHRDCMLADAWSTALGVMGVEEGLALANRLGLCALMLQRGDHGFQEYLSTPLQALLEE